MLRQQKNLVGRLRKWQILLTFSTAFMLTYWVGGSEKVHKFAEDAIYKYITHSIGSAKANMPEYIINRFRKEKRAAMRNAKIRLSNLKLELVNNLFKVYP